MKQTGLPETRRLRRAMRTAGAVGPNGALPAHRFNELLESDIDPYIDAGVLREGQPGSYYLDEPTAAIVIRNHTLKVASFWLLVIALPVAILQMSQCSGG
jgi:hypothetical protein